MSRPARYDVTLEWVDGPAETIAVAADEAVLGAATRAGVALPYGCRTGACVTCVGRVLAVGGDERDDDGGQTAVSEAFDYRREPRALKRRHRRDGYVLLCIATPRADSRIAVGSPVQSELVENPWK